MFLKHVPTGDLIEVIDLPDVINPNSSTLRARSHSEDIIPAPRKLPESGTGVPFRRITAAMLARCALLRTRRLARLAPFGMMKRGFFCAHPKVA